ncbi:MAG: histidine phosphatase family protein [Acidobacteriota bacterium]
MPTRVFLVRHGATTLSAEDRFAGETEVELSEEGREQLHHLAARLAREPLAAVAASPMKRTVESAKILAAPHGLPVLPVDGLREISHGRWEQRTRAEVEARWPEEYACWERDPYTFSPEAGETGLAVTARALPAVVALVNEYAGRSILVVSHKATIRLVLSALIGFDPRTYRDRLDQSPACLNVLDFKGPSQARLTLFNDVSHYAHAGTSTPDLPKGRLSKWWDEPPI